MDEKVFDLITKMYSEMNQRFDSVDNKIKDMDTEIKFIGTEIKSLGNQVLKLENCLVPKVEALFDGYKQNTETLARIEKEVSRQEEIIMRRVK